MDQNDLEGRDVGKWKKCKHRAFVMPTTITIFFKSVRFYKKCNPIKMGFIDDY